MGCKPNSGASLQSCNTTLHFIWSDIADALLILDVNGPLCFQKKNSLNKNMNKGRNTVKVVKLQLLFSFFSGGVKRRTSNSTEGLRINRFSRTLS